MQAGKLALLFRTRRFGISLHALHALHGAYLPRGLHSAGCPIRRSVSFQLAPQGHASWEACATLQSFQSAVWQDAGRGGRDAHPTREVSRLTRGVCRRQPGTKNNEPEHKGHRPFTFSFSAFQLFGMRPKDMQAGKLALLFRVSKVPSGKMLDAAGETPTLPGRFRVRREGCAGTNQEPRTTNQSTRGIAPLLSAFPYFLQTTHRWAA
jgi:hypothetical protein